MPVKSGVVSLVILSVLLLPVSVAAVKSGATPGALGAEASTVTLSVALVRLVLVDRAATVCAPAPSATLGVIV